MKISKKILSLALTVALVASINWTYVVMLRLRKMGQSHEKKEETAWVKK